MLIKTKPIHHLSPHTQLGGEKYFDPPYGCVGNHLSDERLGEHFIWAHVKTDAFKVWDVLEA